MLLVACPGKRDPSVGGSNPGSDSGPPALASCMVNADCRGGELCRDLLCRTACTSSSECAGAYGTCDTAAGYCVLCLTDAQCTSNERCVNRACAFYCRADDACTAQQFCDLPTGTCKDRECTQSADCSGGHTCQHFHCVSIEPVICTANAVSCQGTSVATCNGDGTSLSTMACGNNQTCVAGAPAHCADVVCTPNALGCQDDATATICDSSGTNKTVIPCDAGKYCTGGVCALQACTPNATTCTNDVLQVCNAQGSQSTNTPCSNTPACTSQPHGCACSNNACVPRVCAPGVGECMVNNQVRTCQPDGLTYSMLSACPEACLAGQCVSNACTAGATQCAGAILLTCNAQGNGRTQTDCSASMQICDVMGGVSACRYPASTSSSGGSGGSTSNSSSSAVSTGATSSGGSGSTSISTVPDEVQQPGTNVVWKRCPVGQTWNGSNHACDGAASMLQWAEIASVCGTGYTVPTIDQLIGLTGGCDPYVVVVVQHYGNCNSCAMGSQCGNLLGPDLGTYWSSTPYEVANHTAWGLDFSTGAVSAMSASNRFGVRCVRQ